nr:hypothetical protein [uncultured Treponema sp.]
MSFDNNSNNPEISNNVEINNSNLKPEESFNIVNFEGIDLNNELKKHSLESMADAAMGVYWYEIFLSIGIPYFILSFFGGLAGNLALAFFILFGSYFAYKSIRAFYRIPRSIVPEGKIIIISSWVTWFLYCGVSIFATYYFSSLPTDVKNPDPQTLTLVTTLEVLVFTLSSYNFFSYALFIYRLMSYYLPNKPSGIIAALFFLFFNYVAMLYYTLKLYQFFADQLNYEELKKTYPLKPQEESIS